MTDSAGALPGRTRPPVILIACVSAMLSNAVMMGFFWRLDLDIPPSYLSSHFLAILAAHVLVALVLGGHLADRAWAAAVFVMPVTLSLWPTAERVAGVAGIVAVSVFATAASALWSRLPLGRGAPLVAGTCGTTLGAALLMFRVEPPRESERTPARWLP